MTRYQFNQLDEIVQAEILGNKVVSKFLPYCYLVL